MSLHHLTRDAREPLVIQFRHGRIVSVEPVDGSSGRFVVWLPVGARLRDALPIAFDGEERTNLIIDRKQGESFALLAPGEEPVELIVVNPCGCRFGVRAPRDVVIVRDDAKRTTRRPASQS